jgi:hypothetical protein
MEEVPEELNDEERDDTACPAIVRLAVNKEKIFARALLGNVHTWDQTKLFFIEDQRLEDKRKTKAETEERLVHECAIRVFKGLNCMAARKSTDEDWRNWGRSFGEAMGDLLRIMEAVETGVDVENYPRAMF